MPADWPPFVDSGINGECAALTGQYSSSPSANVGKEPVLSAPRQTAYWDVGHDWLSWLFNLPGRADLSIKYLTIRHEDTDRIVISGIHPEIRGNHPETIRNILLVRSRAEVEIPAGANSATFSCKDGFIKVSNFGFLPVLFPVAPIGMVQTKFIHLRKAVDGSLIVHAGYDTYPTIPLVPLPVLSSVDGYDGWYRYAPYSQ